MLKALVLELVKHGHELVPVRGASLDLLERVTDGILRAVPFILLPPAALLGGYRAEEGPKEEGQEDSRKQCFVCASKASRALTLDKTSQV